MTFEDFVFRITIADNGKGFRLDERHVAGDGLGNMKERLAHLGGACEIRTITGSGTTVMFEFNVTSLSAAAK
jgi:signal transduction histidine kinase